MLVIHCSCRAPGVSVKPMAAPQNVIDARKPSRNAAGAGPADLRCASSLVGAGAERSTCWRICARISPGPQRCVDGGDRMRLRLSPGWARMLMKPVGETEFLESIGAEALAIGSIKTKDRRGDRRLRRPRAGRTGRSGSRSAPGGEPGTLSRHPPLDHLGCERLSAQRSAA